MKNLKLKAKLLVSFAIVGLMLSVAGVFGIVGMNQLDAASDNIFYNNTVPIIAIGNARENLATMKAILFEMFHYTDAPEELRSLMAYIDIEQTEAIENFEIYEAAITDWSEEADYIAGKAKWDADFADFKDTIFKYVNAGEYETAFDFFIENEPYIFDPLIEIFDAVSEFNAEEASEANNAANALYNTLFIAIVVILVIALGVATWISLYVSGLICKPVLLLSNFMNKAGTTGEITVSAEDEKALAQNMLIKDEIGQLTKDCGSFIDHIANSAQTLEVVANGDLTVNIKTLSQNDTIGVSLEKMLSNLNTMFSGINSASNQVSSGSKQIADGAQSLAQGSTEQAASVEELSASIGEIAKKTKENATMAERAATLAGTIMQNAERGSSQMGDMTTAVQEINQASQSISKVIKVIDDIAFQTNILALNAAVEAARAGQHGKGFAVVAEEVRNLAAKSAEAAKDTGGLIQNSMEKAELGARIAGETAESLSDIVAGINESSQIVGEIATSSEEQALGITQINTGIDQVAQVVQQNSATAQESAAASEQMSSQSSMLEELVSQFKLKNQPFDSHTLTSRVTSKATETLPPASNTEAYEPTGGNDFGKY